MKIKFVYGSNLFFICTRGLKDGINVCVCIYIYRVKVYSLNAYVCIDKEKKMLKRANLALFSMILIIYFLVVVVVVDDETFPLWILIVEVFV